MTIILTIVLSILAVIMFPLLGLVYRGAVKWTRVEVKLDNVIAQLLKVVQDKDKVHQEITEQMREDRRATNERLTYLEHEVWKK